MSNEELIQEASLSEANAVKVANTVWNNASSSRANAVYRRMSELNTVLDNIEARKFILSSIEKSGLGGPNIETLANLLSSTPKNQEYQVLRTIALKYRDSIAPAIMLTSKGTPDQVVDDIAADTGLTGVVYADKVQRKKQTIDMVERYLEISGKWENERGGIFLSKPLMQKPIKEFSEMVKNLTSVPSWFLYALGAEGTPAQKQAINELTSPKIITTLMEMKFVGDWPVEQGVDRNELFINWIRNSRISIDEKLSKLDAVFLSLDIEMQKRLVQELSKINDRKVFNKLVQMLDKGETDEVEAITANLSNSIPAFSKLLTILNKRGLISRADPDFIAFINKMRGRR